MVIVMLLTHSCAEKGVYYGRMHLDRDGDNASYAIANLSRGYSEAYPYGTPYAMNFDILNAWEEYKLSREKNQSVGLKEAQAVWKMECKKFKPDSPRESKRNQQLHKRKQALQSQLEVRTRDRLRFLQTFYTDLYHCNEKEFTEKHRYSCSGELLKALFETNRIRHGRQDRSVWPFFTDGSRHAGSDFRFVYLDGQPAKVGSGEDALYLFGDSTRQRTVVDRELAEYISKDERRKCLLGYRFTDAEDKWFRVDMGDHHVYVRVEGQGDVIAITGLVNPERNIYVGIVQDSR